VHNPLFSIVTVSFNSEETILDTFNSIRGQDYNNIEYIVVDGGSNDKTLEIIKKNNDIISHWVSEPDNGIYDAMNKGIKMCTGEFVAILNSDDIYHDNNVVSKVVNHFTENNCDIVYGNLNYVEQYNLEKIVRKWRCSEYKEGFFFKRMAPCSPFFFC
jgi:glycosyltransferase involved in cell wall biosynthesis